MPWTSETPQNEGYYWNRKNKFKNEVLYHLSIDLENSIGKEYNLFWARRCGGLFDRDRPSQIGGKWSGPVLPPE